MKVFIVTENNIKEIYGRVYKFFYNRNKTGFACWHTFDCGFKKKISRYIALDTQKKDTDTYYKYPSPLEVKLNDEQNRIIIYLTATDSFSIKPGDKIAFLGNRIIHKEKWIIRGYDFVYTVYQVLPMNDHEQKSIHLAHERMDAVYRNDFYD